MKTIALCGSARYETEYKTCVKLLTMAGIIAVGLGSYPSENDGLKTWYGETDKHVFDLVHLGKVSAADLVLVIDTPFEPMPDETVMLDARGRPVELPSYIGFSTAKEIAWAAMHEKRCVFLSDLLAGHTAVEEAMGEISTINPYEIPPMELAVARTLLDRALGRLTVAASEDDTRTTLMQAALQAISSDAEVGGDPDNATIASQTLEYLGIGCNTLSEEDLAGYLTVMFGPVTKPIA